MFASTTTDGVVDILKDIKKTTHTNPNVCLVGFGESGINIGKIAGGYTIHSDMGGKKGVKELSAWCEEQDFSLYVDMDVTAFAKKINLLVSNVSLREEMGKNNRFAIRKFSSETVQKALYKIYEV